MQHPEPYWSYRSPPTPTAREARAVGICATERWESLSPRYRRSIWRDALIQEARSRDLPPATMDRLKIALINGWLVTLDEYLDAFQMQDEKRAPIAEDAARLKRADDKHQQAETQILAREML